MRLYLLCWTALVFLGLLCLAPAQTPVATTTFQLAERFGVPFPDQPIEFRYDGGRPAPNSVRMIGPAGAEVPFQWVPSCSDATATKGCIVVRSGLPANAHYIWVLQPGKPSAPAPANSVKLAQVGSNWEMTNGLTGVRLLAEAANPSPWNLAPIQGVLLPNKEWTGAGATPNFLYTSPGTGGEVGVALKAKMTQVTGYSVTVVDSGPVKSVLKASYTFHRPQYAYGQTVINTAGDGHYTITLTMYADSKSILIDEDSDMQFAYYLPLYRQLMPDLARYKGHDSLDDTGVNNPVCGYEAILPVNAVTAGTPIVISAPFRFSDSKRILGNGQRVSIAGVQGNSAANGTFFVKTNGYPAGQFGLFRDANLSQPAAGSGEYTGGGEIKPAYRGRFIDPAADGLLDITYSRDRPASYTCSSASYRKLLVNYPPIAHAAGWYAIFYNSTAPANAPVVGFYTGRASQQFNSGTGPSMPGIYSSDRHWISGEKEAGIMVETLLRGPSGATTTHVHRNWAIWVSTQADLLTPTSHQPIADEQNSLTGINLSRFATYQLVYPDPPGGWKWQYLPTESASRIISWVRNGTPVCGSVNCFYGQMAGSESSHWGKALLDMWRGNSPSAVQNALNDGIKLAQTIERALTTGDNHFDRPISYYQLGLQTSPETAVLNAILMDDNSTREQKETAKAALALFGSLFWDNDWFAIDNPTGEGVGLANQIQQYMQYRAQSAAAGSSQPFLASKLPTAMTYPVADFERYFSATGAPAGSTHYQSAFFEPLIFNFLSFSHSGAVSMKDPKWAAYAAWELSIQTPPEPRFGNLRKAYSNGDGNTEADVRTGLLATALYATDPRLAGQLMWAWRQNNSARTLTEDSQFGTTLVAIDTTIPPAMPDLGSINIPGYHSVERFGFATPNETALWFINGDFYSEQGHRHADDGQVSIYAHNAPLAIDRNANLYNPATPGRFIHNSVVFDKELPHPWSADKPSLADAGGIFKSAANTEFASFTHSATSTATFTAPDGTEWTRTVRTMAFNLSYPIIYVYDSFAGPSAAAGKTLTWNLMASGDVQTPAGVVKPIIRFSRGCQAVPQELPSNGVVFPLGAGLQHFSFAGAEWAEHATRGIDWDLYTFSDASTQEFLIGNWGHGCHALRELTEYRLANGVPFSEIEDILRVHDTGPFTTIILPYRKSEPPARTLTQQACGVHVAHGGAESCFNGHAATDVEGERRILTAYDASPQSAFGVSVSGGPQEVVIESGRITWTVAGNQAGARKLTLSGDWVPNRQVERSGATFSYNYPGGAQTAPVTVVFSRAGQR